MANKSNCATIVLIIKDNHILLVKRKNTGWADGTYAMPGGRLDPHESLTACATRELHEELGIIVDQRDLHFVSLMHINTLRTDGSNLEYALICFVTTQWQGDPVNKEPEMHEEIAWYSLGQLPENLAPFTRDIINAYREKIYFAEFGWDKNHDSH